MFFCPTTQSALAALSVLDLSHHLAGFLGAVESQKNVDRLLILSCINACVACALLCALLARVGWKLRARVPFTLSGGVLAIIFVVFTTKKALDILQLPSATTPAEVRLQIFHAAFSLLLSTGIILLTPFFRKLLEFGLMADEEHQRFITAAETNLQAFILLRPVRNSLRAITDFELIFANAAAQQLLGLDRKQLTGMPLSQVLPNMRSKGIFRRLRYVASSGIPFQGRVQDRNSLDELFDVNLRAVKTDDGIAVVLHDLSEQQQQKRRLAEMNRFAQSIIEDAPFSIIAVNDAGIITAVNGATQVLTQYRREELVGKHSLVILHDPAELSARSVEMSREFGHPVDAGFDTLRATLGPQTSNEGEWNYIRKDGQKIAVHLAMTALRDNDGSITGYLAIAFDISERKALTDSISFLAHHDALTRLPNRTQLNQRLTEALQLASDFNSRVALFVIDLDHFKRINDSLGHAAGDELLVAVSGRLREAVRTTDLIARSGGDEFFVMMPNAGHLDDVQRSGQRLFNAMQGPLQVAGREVNVTASIGVCTYPDFAGDASTLIRNADAAMFAAKNKGRNAFHAFSESMRAANADRLELEADLRRAVERGELILHYQPQVDTKTRRITGVEALLRWNHPVRGMVPPSEFIQVAEEGGMIVPMGEWVIRQACMEGRKMQVEIGGRFIIAVNLSPRQVLQDNLYQVVCDALQQSGLAPEDLELEITENTLMVTSQETLTTLARLRELGVRLAVDDFGTGFSSFSYILEYKVDRLKIDRSFTSRCASDPNASAIVRAVIAMAHGLNMTVVAEGVETEAELSFLLRRRCNEAQGYLFGRPQPLQLLREQLQASVDSSKQLASTRSNSREASCRPSASGIPIAVLTKSAIVTN